MTTQIEAIKPPSFYSDDVEHRRQIADYVKATGDRANDTLPKDGSEPAQKLTYSYLDYAMTANQDDLDLSGYSVVRFSLDGSYNLTGIVADPGRWLVIINASSAANTLTLKNEITSTAENRFKLSGGDIAIPQDGVAIVWYDEVDARWRNITPL